MSESVGALVRRRREDLKISQTDLAWIARVSRGTVGNIERDAVKSEGRTVGAVIDALGMDYPGTHERREIVEKIPASYARRILQIILEVRDGTKGEESSRSAARNMSDDYMEFVSVYEGEDSFEGVRKEYLDAVADFIVPRLEPNSRADRSLISWIEDHGWSPDDYGEDSKPLASPPTGLSLTRDSSVSKGSGESYADGIEEIRVELESIRETIQKIDPKVFAKASAFDRLPLRVQDSLLKGQVADFQVTDIAGGVASSLFIRFHETDVDSTETLIAVKIWEEVNSLLSDSFGILSKDGVEALQDPVAVLDAVEATMVGRARHPALNHYLRERYPWRLDELRHRHPDAFPDEED